MEQSKGDGHNIVSLIMAHKDMDVHQAMSHVAALHESQVDKFLAAFDALPSFNSYQVDSWVREYANGLANWIRANECWSYESWRYFKNDGLRIQQTRIVNLLPRVKIAQEATCAVPVESRYIRSAVIADRPRPENVGIVAIEVYFPSRVGIHLASPTNVLIYNE